MLGMLAKTTRRTRKGSGPIPAIDATDTHRRDHRDRRNSNTTHLALTAGVQGRIHASVDPIQVDGSADALEHLPARRRRRRAHGFV